MEEIITNLIRNHIGLSFLIGLIAIGALIFLIWWSRGVYERIKKIDKLPCDAHTKKIEKLSTSSSSVCAKISDLQCADHKMKLEKQIESHSGLETSIARIETSISFMKENIENLTQNLQKSKGIITDPYTQSQSPLSITAEGHKMVERLHIKEKFDNNWDRIKILIDENTKSKTPYDIQQFCIEQSIVFPEKFLKEEELLALKMDAYKTGGSLTSYMRVMAVMARDRYFYENGIDVSEVDVFDPNVAKAY